MTNRLILFIMFRLSDYVCGMCCSNTDGNELLRVTIDYKNGLYFIYVKNYKELIVEVDF